MSREFGDFQTPDELVAEVRSALRSAGVTWDRVLEPTCGAGSFLVGFTASDPVVEARGIELQPEYVQAARARLLQSRFPQDRFDVVQASLFDVDLRELEWSASGPLLVVGNPPWVTNSELGSLNSRNLPRKTNPRLLNGLDAVTGAANFDLTEFIWLKVIEELKGEGPVVAFLCKTQVARNVLEYVRERRIRVARAAMWRLDARRWFDAAVDACLFMLDLREARLPLTTVDVFESLSAAAEPARMAFLGDELINVRDGEVEVERYVGKCDMEWRQGVKHDAARVMELRASEAGLRNGLGELVEIEADFVFPLLKGSDLFNGRTPSEAGKSVVVPQTFFGEDTQHLRESAPYLWRYLNDHADVLDGRRSSIYRTQPRFALFGLGPYSFAPFKVAVSGLHKDPRFRLVAPHEGRPVFVDDTCYFLSFDAIEPAAIVAALLDGHVARQVIDALIFRDSKRPIKKKLLARLDLRAMIRDADDVALRADAERLARESGFPFSVAPSLESALPALPLFAGTS